MVILLFIITDYLFIVKQLLSLELIRPQIINVFPVYLHMFVSSMFIVIIFTTLASCDSKDRI